MKTKILIVGKTVDQNLKALIYIYLNWIYRFISCDLIDILEIKNKSKKEKCEFILSRIHPKDKVCFLDERSVLLDSI
ncbi:MAG: 23S rRNA (pseudouridine(1915)-N(3))-methyltransferase RlmH [Flavobacteriales bacterium]